MQNRVIALFCKEQMGYLKLMHTSKIEPMHLQVIYKILRSYKHDNLFLSCENSHNICCVHLLQLSNLLKYSPFSCSELEWEGLGCVVTINMKKKKKFKEICPNK